MFTRLNRIINNEHILKKFINPQRTLSKLSYGHDPEDEKDKQIFQLAMEKANRKVYMWGNAVTGALGNPNFLFPQKHQKPVKTMHRPFRMEYFDKVIDIACGYRFTVIAGSADGSSHTVFGTGLNGDSQIGYHCVRKGHPLQILAEPVPIVLPLLDSSTKAIKVSCGRAHTVIVTDKEGVFTLGNNSYGQCCCPIVREEIFRGNTKVNKVEDIGEEISEVVCGQDHTLFLTVSGKVYSCGWGADGQTGLGHYNNQTVPTEVKGDIQGEKIVQLSSAADCVLAVSEKGDVFGWGNSEYGQLHSVTDAQQINISKHLKLKNVERVSQVAAGGTMCAVLTDQGQVYVWGYGILGRESDVTGLLEPTLLPEFLFGINECNLDEKIEQITCNLSHFAAVTNKGALFMWGRNRLNCLGIGELGNQFFPLRVSVPEEVKKVSCGVDHTAVLCGGFL